MAIDVGLALKIDPRLIIKEWYPYQLSSVYAQVMNNKYTEAYVLMDSKEKAKNPEVFIARILTEEELESYKRQRISVLSKLNKVKK